MYLLFLFRIKYTAHNETKKKEGFIMTKIAICYLRNRIEKQIDNEDEKLRANAFLNVIEQFLKKNN